ncbi:MAG: DUF4406 domain-containing protein [Ethanoligenens sp.]
MKLAYICSPYAGNVPENIRFARAACRFAIQEGFAPVAPHLLYPQLLNDAVPAERGAGLQMGLRLLSACDELWICGETISSGMNQEIAEAKRLGIHIRTAPTQLIQTAAAEPLLHDAEPAGQAEQRYQQEREIVPEEAPASGMKLNL